MSHFTTVHTQLKDAAALAAACQELGVELLDHAVARGYGSNQHQGEYVIKLKGPYDIALNRQQAVLQQMEQAILVQVRSVVRAVGTNQENVRISSLATELSQKQFEQEKARYEAGLSTFRFVQQSQADLDTARVNELQAKVNLRNALADLAKLEGSALARYKISLAPTPDRGSP